MFNDVGLESGGGKSEAGFELGSQFVMSAHSHLGHILPPDWMET